MRARSTLLAALSLAFLAGCGGDEEGVCGGAAVGPNQLDGSYCEGLDLRFTEVRIKMQTSGESKFVTIDYLLAGESSTPLKTLSILFEATAVNIQPDQPVLLFDVNATVRRFSQNAQLDLTQELESTSQIVFSTYGGEIGTEAKGEFSLLFMNGRTLNGTFDGTIVDALDTVGG